MKKLSLVLAMIMIFSCFTAIGSVSAASDIAIIDTEAALKTSNSNQASSLQLVAADLGNERGMGYYAPVVTTGTGNMWVDFPQAVTSGKINIGMDVKLDPAKMESGAKVVLGICAQNVQGTYGSGRTDEYVAGGELHQRTCLVRYTNDGFISINRDSNGESRGSNSSLKGSNNTAAATGQWYRVDVVLDLDNQTKTLYVDGAYVGEYQFRSIGKNVASLAIWYRAQGTLAEGALASDVLCIDNISAVTVPSSDATTAVVDGNDIYVWYGAAKASDVTLSTSNVSVENVADRTKKLTVTGVTEVGTSGVKISTDGFENMPNGEYQVVLPDELTGVAGAAIQTAVLSYNAATTVTHFDYKFEDEKTGLVSSATSEIVAESEGSSNHVLKIPANTTNQDFMATSEYSSITRSITDTTISLSFKAMKPGAATQKAQIAFIYSNEEDAKSYVPEALWHFRADTGGNFTTFYKNADAKGDWQNVSKIYATWEADKWYTVKMTYKFGNVSQKGSARYEFIDVETSETVLDEIFDIPAENLMRAEGFAYPEALFQGVRFVNNDSATEMYIDDVICTSTYDAASIKSVRFVDTKGTKYIPDVELPTDICKIELNCSGITSATELDGMLKLNGEVLPNGTYDSATSIYTVELDGILSPKTDYTFTIDPVESIGISAYSTSFKTGEGKFEVISVAIVDENGDVVESIADVTGTLRVAVTAVNTTGEDVSGTILYGQYSDEGKCLKDFDFKEVSFASTGEQTLYFEIGTIATGVDTVKGFIWNNMQSMTPMHAIAEI